MLRKIYKYKHGAKKTWSIMKELIGKIKLKSSNLLRIITNNELIFLMNVKLQINLTLSLQISGVNWQKKIQMFQQPSNPT